MGSYCSSLFCSPVDKKDEKDIGSPGDAYIRDGRGEGRPATPTNTMMSGPGKAVAASGGALKSVQTTGPMRFIVTKGLKSTATAMEVSPVHKMVGQCHGASDLRTEIVTKYGYGEGSFVKAMAEAWSKHWPIALAPDHIWILVLQGFSQYVNKNSDKMRDKFVSHAGKEKLWVRDDSLVLNKVDNDWSNGINGWTEQIDQKVNPDAITKLHAQFSTTTNATSLAFKVMIMDTMKSYFDYGMQTDCGFPSVTLDGTREDWYLLARKTEQLLGLVPELNTKWGKAIVPLIHKFIEPFDNPKKIDHIFWNSMIKRGATHGSGARSWYTGWINILFPYLKDGENRFAMTPYSPDLPYGKKLGLNHDNQGFRGLTDGPDMNKFPSCAVQIPVDWLYNGTNIDIVLESGFMGIEQDKETLALRPFTGWRVLPKELVKVEKEPDHWGW